MVELNLKIREQLGERWFMGLLMGRVWGQSLSITMPSLFGMKGLPSVGLESG